MKQAEYARRRGVSRQAVAKAIKQGRITVLPDGGLDPEIADREWAANRGAKMPAAPAPAAHVNRRQLPEPFDPTEFLTFDEARALREQYAAERERLKLEQEAGLLIEAAEVKAAWFAALRTVRERLLNVPDRLAQQLAAEGDAAQVHAALLQEIRFVLENLSDEIAHVRRR